MGPWPLQSARGAPSHRWSWGAPCSPPTPPGCPRPAAMVAGGGLPCPHQIAPSGPHTRAMCYEGGVEDLEGLDDSELVALVQRGREDAFGVLYQRYLKKVYNLVYRMVGPRDAEEVTQESFLQAYRTLKRFRGDARFYTWLYRVASNTALQHLRKRGRREKRSTSYEAMEAAAPGLVETLTSSDSNDPHKAAEEAELQEHVKEVLEGLPPNQKLVMLLGPIQGMSYDEMAKVLETSVPVVKARLHRARENLRKRFAASYHSGVGGAAGAGREAAPPKTAEGSAKGPASAKGGEGRVASPRGPPASDPQAAPA